MNNVSTIALIVSLSSVSWQVISFVLTRNADAKNRNFEAYHRLIKELVKPEDGATYADRQVACLFELRRFSEYREVTLRILEGLSFDWRHFKGKGAQRLLNELSLTINCLKEAE